MGKKGLSLIYVYLGASALLFGCFSRSTIMSRDAFDSITLGEPVEEVKSKVGSPYAVHEKNEHSVEYEYVERLYVDQDYSVENHYYLTISAGQVVAKRFKVQRTPAYNLIYEEDPNYLEY